MHVLMYACLSLNPCVCVSGCPFFCMSVCLSVCLTVCLSFYLCVPLSMPLFLSPIHHFISPWISRSPPPPSLPPSLFHSPPHTLLSSPLFSLSVMSLCLQHAICGGVLFRINTTESCRPRRQGVWPWTTWGRHKSREIGEGPTSRRISKSSVFDTQQCSNTVLHTRATGSSGEWELF